MMKQILTTILLWTAFCLTGHAQAKATFDKKTHEFGVVLWKHPATAVFTVKNDGDKPLVISNVTTSCQRPPPTGGRGLRKLLLLTLIIRLGLYKSLDACRSYRIYPSILRQTGSLLVRQFLCHL